MKAKLEARTTFESEIFNDPIMLIKAIKQHSLCFEESRYEMATIYDATKNYVNCKQKEQGKESLLDYTRRFKLSRDLMTSRMGGPFVLNKYVEETYVSPGRLTRAHQTLNDDADERLAACMYLVNSDQNKYRSVIKILDSQKSLKNDQFHKTVTDAHNVLSNHAPEKGKNKKDVLSPKIEDETKVLAFAQAKLNENKCFICDKKRYNVKHMSSERCN